MVFLRDVYGNASSIHHYGQAAKQLLETARRELADLVACDPKEIVFVSGGTESDNLAVLGSVRGAGGTRKHVITSSIEHPAVLGACAQLEREGVEVTRVPVGSDGVVAPNDVRRALRPDTVLISLMHVNNELGTIQPVAEVAAIAREAGILMHSDGVQALGKVPVGVAALGVNLYSMSGHKLYAPKGVGALFVRQGTPLAALLHGGRHEKERRAGTESVPAIAAFGFAAQAAGREHDANNARFGALRDRLEQGILARLPHVFVNGLGAPRVSNTTNLRFEGIEGEAMVIGLDLQGFAVSSGAACSSGAVEPSHVLTAIGLSVAEARSSLRFSLGRSNTEGQVDLLIDAVAALAGRLRKLSPTYAGD